MRPGFHPPKQSRGSEGNRHSIDIPKDHVFGRFGIINSRGHPHEINNDFISDADDVILLQVSGLEFPNRVVGKRGKR